MILYSGIRVILDFDFINEGFSLIISARGTEENTYLNCDI